MNYDDLNKDELLTIIAELNNLIGDLKNSNQQLRKTEEQYTHILEQTDQLFFVIGVNGEILYINPQIKPILGYEVDEFSKLKLSDLLTDNPVNKIAVQISEELRKSGKKQPAYEVELFHKNGKRILLEVDESPVFDSTGKMIARSGAARNIQERKIYEKELKYQRDLFELVINAVPINIFWKDRNSVYLGCNTHFIQDSGMQSADEIIGKTDDFLVWKPDADVYRADDKLVMDTGIPKINYEEQYLDNEGNTVWWKTNKIPLKNSAGEIIGVIATSENITEQKHAKIALQKSEIKHRTYVENAPLGIFVIDGKGNILDVNRRACELLTYKQEELLALSIPELSFTEKSDESYQKPEKPSVIHYESKLQRKDGSTISVRLDSVHIANDQYLIFCTNISQRKQTENDLQVSEQKFRNQANFLERVIENSPFAMHIMDANGVLIRANQALRKILNVTDDMIVGKYNILHDENLIAQEVMPAVEAVFNDLKNARFTIYWTGTKAGDVDLSDANQVWIDVSIIPIADETGELTNVVCQYVDITKRKQAEKNLEASIKREKELADVVRNAPIAIAFGYPDGRLENSNDAFSKLTGYTTEELNQTDWNEVLTPPRWRAHESEKLSQFNFSNKIIQYEKEYLRKDGSLVPIELTVTAEFDPSGNIIHYIGFITDITERKQMQTALENERNSLAQRVQERTAALHHANTELTKAMQAKDEFLANMSHELRTPLTAILGQSELLEMGIRGPLSHKQIESIQTIHQSGEHLLVLINDILDLSKLEAGKLEIQPVPVNIKEVCLDSITLVQEMANKKNIAVSCNLPDEQLEIFADPLRLKQILVNLLSNAVKFTPPDGNVSLDVALKRKQELVSFMVQDNGIGIARKDMSKLFRSFSQLDASLSRPYEGSGLGLALVKKLVELHQGEVFVESEGISGKGSRFTVLLPWGKNYLQ